MTAITTIGRDDIRELKRLLDFLNATSTRYSRSCFGHFWRDEIRDCESFIRSLERVLKELERPFP